MHLKPPCLHSLIPSSPYPLHPPGLSRSALSQTLSGSTALPPAPMVPMGPMGTHLALLGHTGVDCAVLVV